MSEAISSPTVREISLGSYVSCTSSFRSSPFVMREMRWLHFVFLLLPLRDGGGWVGAMWFSHMSNFFTPLMAFVGDAVASPPHPEPGGFLPPHPEPSGFLPPHPEPARFPPSPTRGEGEMLSSGEEEMVSSGEWGMLSSGEGECVGCTSSFCSSPFVMGEAGWGCFVGKAYVRSPSSGW